MISTDAGLSVQTATMKIIDQLDKADAPLIPEGYIYLLCNASSHSPTTSRGIHSLSTTPSRSKNHPRVQPSPSTRPYYAARTRASPGQATNCARDAEHRLARASCGPLLRPYHEPLRLHLW
ncbi:hypothetical protein F5888DRAFT_1708147 [Russula emetica]|nr:hypothetical protein F5888DRAFT_1708147 [Russula emetica]